MYYLTIALLMFFLPIGSILVEFLVFRSSLAFVSIIGKWFVFWGVGGRLLLAGLRQAIQPRFTAETILGIKGDGPLQVVQELGFANMAMGAIGLISIFNSAWVIPSAIAGCLFYGFAGIRHAAKGEKNAVENAAMWSDLFVSAVLLMFIVVDLARAVE